MIYLYECSKCKDTGYVLDDGKSAMCSCLKQQILNIEYNNSNIGNLDRENFKKFNLNLYSDEVNEEKYGSDLSPRENIKVIGKEVKKFIKNFDDPNEKNLLFSGGTGLGKTFLSNCIPISVIRIPPFYFLVHERYIIMLLCHDISFSCDYYTIFCFICQYLNVKKLPETIFPRAFFTRLLC